MTIFPLLLGLAFSGDFPTIQGVSAEVGEDRLVVEVRTTEPMAAEDLRTKLTGKSLFFYLEGIRVSGGKQVLAQGKVPVTAYPRVAYTKLEVPWPAEWTCSGPVSTRVVENGARATVACQRRGAAPTQAAPAENGAAAEVEAGAAAAAAAETAPAAAAEAAPEAVAAVEAAPAAAPSQADPKELDKASKTQAVPEPKRARASSTPPWAIVSGLALVAFAGYFVWRRRRQQQSSLIRILETASLGPRRALIVAEINGERVILGSSEAGISVIGPPVEGEGAHRTPGPVPLRPPEASAPSAVALPEESEGGLLARLFTRRREADLIEGDDPPSTMAEDFRDLLQDSLEDEELRHRLASGMGGRTS